MGQIGSGGAPSWCNGLSGEIQMDHIGGAAREPGCQWQIGRGPRDIACLRRSQKRYATRSAPYHQNITLPQPDKGNTARADGLRARCASRMTLQIKGRATWQAGRCFRPRIAGARKRNRPINARCPRDERPGGSADKRKQACGIACDLHVRITVSRHRELPAPFGRDRGRRLRRALQSQITLQLRNEIHRAAEITRDDQKIGNRRSPGSRPRLTGADKRQTTITLHRSRDCRCSLGDPADRKRGRCGCGHARFGRARQRDVGRSFYRRGGTCTGGPRDLDDRI